MAKSRYSDVAVIDGKFFGSFSLPRVPGGLRNVDLLAGVKTVEHTLSKGERPDHLAARFLGDESYWWVICLVNNISYPFASGGWVPGLTLKIPSDVQDVLKKIMR